MPFSKMPTWLIISLACLFLLHLYLLFVLVSGSNWAAITVYASGASFGAAFGSIFMINLLFKEVNE